MVILRSHTIQKRNPCPKRQRPADNPAVREPQEGQEKTKDTVVQTAPGAGCKVPFRALALIEVHPEVKVPKPDDEVLISEDDAHQVKEDLKEDGV